MVGGEVLWVPDSDHLKYAAVCPQGIVALPYIFCMATIKTKK